MGSTLLVVSWSSEMAVVVIASVLKSVTGNDGRPTSDTSMAISVFSARTPVTFFGVLPNSLTTTLERVLVG